MGFNSKHHVEDDALEPVVHIHIDGYGTPARSWSGCDASKRRYCFTGLQIKKIAQKYDRKSTKLNSGSCKTGCQATNSHQNPYFIKPFQNCLKDFILLIYTFAGKL